MAGWVNTKVWDETGDAQKAVGWFPFVLDSNGNGKLDEFAEPGKPEDGKDMRFNPGSGPYAVMPHPTDGSIWYTSGVFGGTPGFLRFDPKTKLSEFYAVPKEGVGLRGGDIGADGVLYGSGSAGHLDRVRPAQVQGAAQRAERDRQSLPGGLDAAQVSGPGLRRLAELERRGELLHLGRPSQHGRARRRTCRSRPPTCRTASSASRTAR